MPMKMRRLLPIALGLALGMSLATHAVAQDPAARDLGDVLTDFLRGTSEPATERRVPFSRQDIQLSYAPLVRSAAPAVVNVYASAQVQARSPFRGDPFFEQFFNRQMPPRVQSSLGSGVLVDASGLVVTNYHVIRGADQVKVALSDGREFESTILLRDESLDLAVLKIESDQEFPVVAIGDSDALEVGDLVLAIGNPFGVGQTTTSGIVSALARTHVGISDFGFFIQTDAAINPGNSGGALINMSGEVVGINTAIFSQSGGSIGIGFAIPSNIVSAVVGAARDGRDAFERPYVGASFDVVTSQAAEALGMSRPTGALISNVVEGGPAAEAGLRPGDVVLAFGGVAIEHPDALGYRLATRAAGETARLTVLRQGAEIELDVVLAEQPEGAVADQIVIQGESPFAGAKVTALTPEIAPRLRAAPSGVGVAIIEMDPSSAAAGVGLRPGDVVREVNGEQVATPQDLERIASSGTRWWRFTVERQGQIMRQMLRF